MKSAFPYVLALLATLFIIVTLAFSQSSGSSDSAGTVGSGLIGGGSIGGTDSGLVFSRVRIVNFNNTIIRLDTATGSLNTFRGTLTGRNARGTWQSFTRPVSSSGGSSSRFFDLQSAGGALFLVDTESGDTWILRGRGNIAVWDPVRLVGQ
jgi:hypothetical protein